MRKTLPKKSQEIIINQLKDVLRISRMEHCDFGPKTDEIKEATRLWRASWITEPLERMIKLMEVNARFDYWRNGFTAQTETGETINFDRHGYEESRYPKKEVKK